jgi:hypothetical protein
MPEDLLLAEFFATDLNYFLISTQNLNILK